MLICDVKKGVASCSMCAQIILSHTVVNNRSQVRGVFRNQVRGGGGDKILAFSGGGKQKCSNLETKSHFADFPLYFPLPSLFFLFLTFTPCSKNVEKKVPMFAQ